MWKYVIGLLLVVHGLIHALGFAATWNLGNPGGISPTPTLPSGSTAGSSTVLVLGVVWLVAGAGFAAAGTGVVCERGWAVGIALTAAILSLLLTVMWWQSAPAGIAIDAVILLAVAAATLRGKMGGRPAGKET